MIEKLVDAELAIASLNEPAGRAQVAYTWSMTRQASSQAFSVEADGDESSIVAGDLRFEILTDPVHFELTRGVTVTIHQYDTIEATDSTAQAKLRRTITTSLQTAVIDNCFRLPY